MANYHSVSFAVAGSKEAVNRAILLMAENVTGAGAPVTDMGTPKKNFDSYRHAIEDGYYRAFAGEESQDRYMDGVAGMSYHGNRKACVVSIGYSTAWRLNSNDIDTFVGRLAQTCSFEAVALHADEYDGYDEVYDCSYSVAAAGDDVLDDCECVMAGDLLQRLKEANEGEGLYKRTDPAGLAWVAAADSWGEWGGPSVLETLQEAGVFGDMAEGEARELTEEFGWELVGHYARGRKLPKRLQGLLASENNPDVEWVKRGTCEWSIDPSGTLVVRPAAGASEGKWKGPTWPWTASAKRGKVKSARFEGVVHVEGRAGSMFHDCSSLASVDLSGLDTSSATSMAEMFSGCSSLASVDLSGLDTSSVTDMKCMFQWCFSLTSVNLSVLDTSSVTDMKWMFSDCSSLASIDLSGLDTSSATDMLLMFDHCSSLQEVVLGPRFKVASDFRLPGEKWLSSADGKEYDGHEIPSCVAATYTRQD
ncbi:BspA family leucine-rich repeat surface protein [Paratractidigestivibacter sp.]|uniref:BspA family leucine-rich repeat surface protein n=1 Tax=Paratractidigestivibacter sp. TaxID=2847316 RepID=UPI002ABE8587|nr:BspA family leucine-rich repeat surface protein [Paratractidigestivibacter sp.]